MYVCMRIMIFFSFEPTGDPRAAVRIISKKDNSSMPWVTGHGDESVGAALATRRRTILVVLPPYCAN